MTLNDMRERFRMLLTTTGQQSSASEALARRVNRYLLVFGDHLYDLDSEKSREIGHENPQDAAAIAAAAAALTGDDRPDAECILLLLPPSEFLADSVSLPDMSPEAMRAALSLRAMTGLPELDQPLDLALTHSNGAAGASGTLVWWLPAARANSLFAAFAEQSLFLAAILPRPAWLMTAAIQSGTGPDVTFEDTDGSQHTVIACIQGKHSAQLHCFQTLAEDLADPLLAQQWHNQLAQAGIGQIGFTVGSGADFMRLRRNFNTTPDTNAIAAAIIPAPALAARHLLNRGRRRRQLLGAVAAVLALVMLPFLYQSWQLARLNTQLAEIRALSAGARQHQADVRDFETQWGVFTEFPDQDVGETMLALQTVINPGVLSLFEIDEGLISIEGESQDPQNLLEQLEQNPLFTEVDFARATNNNRYFIDLRLSTVNFPAYQQWHFPESR